MLVGLRVCLYGIALVVVSEIEGLKFVLGERINQFLKTMSPISTFSHFELVAAVQYQILCYDWSQRSETVRLNLLDPLRVSCSPLQPLSVRHQAPARAVRGGTGSVVLGVD